MNSFEYLIGTCYQCAKCLYCKQDSFEVSCNCNKNIIPTTRNRTKLVPWAFTVHYNKKFNNKQIKVLEDSREKYNYNIEFTKDFKFSFCSACNSKWYRIGKTKSAELNLIKSINTTENFTSNMNKNITNIFETNELNDNSVDYSAVDTPVNEIEDSLSDNGEESDLDNFFERLLDNENDKYKNKEFFLKLCIKNQDNTTLPAKRLNISADSCREFHNQILTKIQLQLNNIDIAQNDYVLAYKVTKETGAGTQINDESDFNSFINDYNQAISKKKEVFINIQIRNTSNNSLKSNSKKQLQKSVLFIIYNI